MTERDERPAIANERRAKPLQPRRRSSDQVDKNQVLAAGGEMGALMRSVDWSKTELGPVSEWSHALRTMVGVLLGNRFPILLWWGPGLVQLYNDAYRPILGAKHPKAMGQPASECWSGIWHVIGPMIEAPLSGQLATWSDDLLLLIDRHGFLEETHFKVAYSPVPDETVQPTGVGGVLATVAEITEQVYGERQLRTLRELGARAAEQKTPQQACETAAATFKENEFDISFALLYLIEPDGKRARLASSCGFAVENGPANPSFIDLEVVSGETPWPVSRIIHTRNVEVLTDLRDRFVALPNGRWSEPPRYAISLPLASPDQARPYGVLIAGCSPHRELDDGYRTFFELAAAQVVTAIRNANALEEQRLRAEALGEIDRAKTTFFSNVSHEFRTPLTLMLGPTEDLLAGAHGALAAPQVEQLELLHRSGLRLQKLVNALLDFSRIEAGRIQASYEATDLAALTRDLASAFRSAAEKAGLTFTVACPPLEELIYVDRDMWEKIVLNLISNAFKFTFEGAIEVSLQAHEGSVLLRVKDTGGGIPPDEVPRLFERFHRVAGARARTHEGSGIGLALVQELTRLHGGSVHAESELGAGTSFTVTIPKGSAHLPQERIGAVRNMAPTVLGTAPYVEETLRWLPGHQLAAPSSPPPAAEAKQAEHILVADDNADMRDYVRGLLEPHWSVEVVEDGAKALAAALARPPDLVLTDVMMPGLDGFQLIAALRADERTRTIPTVMFSARAGEEAKVEGLGAGADDYLIKPFSARELVARVRSQLDLRRLRRNAEQALRESEERYRFMFEAAEVSIWDEDFSAVKALIDELQAEHGDGLRAVLEADPSLVERALGLVRIRDVNPATLRMFGASSKEQLLTSLQTIFTPDTRAVFLEVLMAILDGKSRLTSEAHLQTLSGDRRDVLLTIRFPPPGGTFERVLVTLMDISARKQVEQRRQSQIEALERTIRFSETFIGILSHDLRNPLGAIAMAANLLVRRARSDEIRTPANRIVISAERMTRMIDQLLDFTRIRLGRGLPMLMGALDLSELCGSVADELEAATGCTVRFEQQGNLDLRGDRDRLFQLLSNLVGNACEHRRANTGVTLSADGSQPHSVLLTAHNEGLIAEHDLPLLFDPLQAGTGRRRKGSSGLGLGLYISQQIVVAHGGTLRVESNEENGTRFVVELPRRSGEHTSHTFNDIPPGAR